MSEPRPGGHRDARHNPPNPLRKHAREVVVALVLTLVAGALIVAAMP